MIEFKGNLHNALTKAIKSYDFPLITFDFLNSRQITHKNVVELETAIRDDLVSGNNKCVKDGLSNILHWGFARKPGLQEKRIRIFREKVMPSQIKEASRLFQRIQGPSLRLIKSIGMPQFKNMSFISKVRMFLDPDQYVVLDLKLRDLKNKKPINLFNDLRSQKTYIPITVHNEKIYERWSQFCRIVANKYFRREHFRAVEIERGIFYLLDNGKADIAVKILTMLSDKQMQSENTNQSANYTDSLRGYAFPIHKRDHFKCRYCGLDGLESFENWLSL